MSNAKKKTPNKPEPEKLNDGHYHEALDRTYVIQDIIDRQLMDHPAISQTPAWKKIVQQAQDKLGELYLLIGAK